MANLKELVKRQEVLTGGHRLCAGCGAPIIIRQMSLAQDIPLVVGCATGCVEVSTTIHPYTAWRCSYVHCAFENVAATVSGVEAAYKSLTRRGKIKEEFRFVAIGGDGGTYDIGLQSLSGMLERGHRVLYLCYNNEAYMNCLSLSSMIMTKDGLKRITEIKEGDEVYAFDQNTYELVLKKCTGVFDNGEKEVFQLETLHHSIKATGNHPFLVLKRNIFGHQEGFVWKILNEINIGDELVALKSLNGIDESPYSYNRKVDCASTNGSKAKVTLVELDTELLVVEINKYFETEKVRFIKSVGIEPTLDLRVEGEHNFIADGIVVHNTGIQRSSATPKGAQTTTAPVGEVQIGKKEYPKDLTGIVVAHRIPYVAQASPGHWNDLVTKSQKALSVDGPSFLNVISPCPLGWVYPVDKTIEIAKLAVDTCFWPLFEVENGTTWKLNYKPAVKKSITEYLQTQGRFRHLLRPENKSLVEEIQRRVDEDWAALLKRCGEQT